MYVILYYVILYYIDVSVYTTKLLAITGSLAAFDIIHYLTL